MFAAFPSHPIVSAVVLGCCAIGIGPVESVLELGDWFGVCRDDSCAAVFVTGRVPLHAGHGELVRIVGTNTEIQS